MLQPPIEPMLAAPVKELPAQCRGGCGYEPKWDGWRCLAFGDVDGRVHLQSRSGKPLSSYFPEVSRLFRQHLPRHVVVDGELVIWESGARRTSFVQLQRRVAPGTRPVKAARETPAHFVLFDLLQDDRGNELLGRPLSERRQRLAQLLAAAPPQLILSPHTTDRAEALEWHNTWVVAGVEGLVVKGLRSTYRPGARGWSKLRHRNSTEAIVGGVTGSRKRPESVLAGRFDGTGRLRYLGRTNDLTDRQAAELAERIAAPPQRRSGGIDHPWPRPLPAEWSAQLDHREPLRYLQVEPAVVVEVEVDAAYEHHRWRHGARYLRVRGDMSIHEVPLAE